MGVKLMTGATGEQNIEAADDRECLAGITGLDSYVFDTGSKLKATLVDANTVTIGTGAGSMQGSRFRCPTTTTVTIKSGTQGQYRHDIVGLHFSREPSGKESLEFQVLTGEPASSDGAAEDPEFAAGNLLKGDAEAFMPLYRVRLSGINAADPEPMFSVLTPLATLGDAVYPRQGTLSAIGGWELSNWAGQQPGVYVNGNVATLCGTIIRRAGGFTGAAWSKSFDIGKVSPRPRFPNEQMVYVNGQSGLNDAHFLLHIDTSGTIYVRAGTNFTLNVGDGISLDGYTYIID